VIPQEVELFMAPVRYDPDRDRTSAWVENYRGLDLSSVRDIAVNQVFPIRLDQGDMLGPGAPMLKVDLREDVKDLYEGRNSIQIGSNGVLQGLGGWFRSFLVDDVSITNAPPNQVPSWWHVFFPLEAPLEVQEGDYLLLEASTKPSGGEWSWKVKRQADVPNLGDEVTDWDFEHQMVDGEIMPRREGRDFDIRPTLDSDAILDLHLLQAMDGNNSIREIAEDVIQKFPGTFRNQETAREHVYSFYEDYGVRQE
jgi:protein arginine N-methyltransferase 1